MVNRARKRAGRTSEKPSKAAFVRAQPPGTSVDDIIAAGEGIGLSLSKSYVYSVRTKDRMRAKANGKAAPKRAKANGKANGVDAEHTKAMMRIVLDLGMRGARDLLVTIEDTFTRAVN